MATKHTIMLIAIYEKAVTSVSMYNAPDVTESTAPAGVQFTYVITVKIAPICGQKQLRA